MTILTAKGRFTVKLILCIFVHIFSLYQPAAQAQDTFGANNILRSASELDYPPFAIIHSDGTPSGFSVDLLKAVAEAAGFSISFKVGPWHEIKQELADSSLDVLPLVSYSVEREKVFDFTTPYMSLNGTVFVRKGNENIKELSDLKGKEVLVMQGDTAHEYVLKHKLSDIIITTENYEEAFRLLSSGKHDAVVVQQIAGLQLVKKLNIDNVIPVFKKNIYHFSCNDTKLNSFLASNNISTSLEITWVDLALQIPEYFTKMKETFEKKKKFPC